MMKSIQRGFTLIELVVVIVILGILAAFALPKFMGLEKQARVASLRGVEGSLRSGAALAHSIWLAQGTNPATIAVDGQNINMTNGYPDAAQIDRVLAPGTIQAGVAGRYVFTAGTPSTLVLTGGTTAATCQVNYASATLNVATGVVTPPVINVPSNGTGC